MTRNQGGSWTNATKAPLPNRYVSDIAVSPTSATKAYVVFNGFDTHTPGTPGHVFRTTNGGRSWQNITSNLPDIPVLTIAIDPQNPSTLYIGTDIGAFRSTDDGGSWAAYNQGLPNAPLYDLELNNTTRQLWAGTHGRGMFRLALAGQAPTATPTPTRRPSTATPTRTPTFPALNRRLWLPAMLKGLAPRPTATPTRPASGPAPGDWAGGSTTFGVTTSQGDVWNVRIRVPVPGCETWVMNPSFSRISGNNFSFTVDLRENGLWTNQGQFTSGTQASGTANFQNMYFGQSCGTWSGSVNWSAVWQGHTTDPTATPTPTPAVGDGHTIEPGRHPWPVPLQGCWRCRADAVAAALSGQRRLRLTDQPYCQHRHRRPGLLSVHQRAEPALRQPQRSGAGHGGA